MSRRNRGNLPARPRPAEEPEQQTLIEQRQYWQGPLPPPSTLEQFRQVAPDLPERIVVQWEDETKHRRRMEEVALRGNLLTVRVGQFGAIALGLSLMAVACVALWFGYPAAATIIGGVTVVSVVGAFLYQRNRGE